MALEEKICGENGNCLYCGSPLSSEGVVYCSRCVTPHHQDCFAEAGCSIFACGGKESSDTPDRYSQIADQAATTLPATVPVSTPSLVQQVGCALRYRFDHIDSDRIVSKFRKFDHAKPFKENCRPNNLEGSLRAYSRSIFVMIRGLFDRMSEESCYPTDLDKTVTREFPVFYDTYTDQIARQIKELMSLGFKSCPIPQTSTL